MKTSLEKKLESGLGKRFGFTPVGLGLERAFVFAGQSSPFAGSFREELAKFPVIRNHFDRADKIAAAAGLPQVSLYLTEPDRLNAAEQLEIQTLALLTLEVGLSRALMQSGCCPLAVSGHSFGEYAALVVAGVLSFNDGVKVVIHRDKISPAPNEMGYLVAVQADLATLREVLEGQGSYFVSHQNSLKQSVVASPWETVVELESLLKSKKLAHRRLPVPQPYHSPLMERTHSAMREFLGRAQFDIQAPRIPVFSSVAHAWVTRESFSKELVIDIISRQMIEPIDFIRQSQELSRFKSVVEVGPSNLCSQFLTASVKEIRVSSFGEWLVADKFNTEEKREPKNIRQETLALVKKTIARLTGYEIETIKVEDRLQEDLGLDSLKLTEVAVSVIEEMGEDPNRRFQHAVPRTIEDFAWNLDQMAQSGKPAPAASTSGLSLSSAPYLDDHRIGGRAYFPFVLGVGRFYDESARKDQDSLTLYDIRVEKPMLMTATNSATWKQVSGIENENWELGVLEPALFASARALTSDSRPPVTPLPPASPSTQFRYDASGLFHGPRFQMIERLDWIENGAVAQLGELGDLPWYLSLDSAFQIMGLMGLRDKMVYLPVGAERIDFIKKPKAGTPFLMWLRNLHHDSRFITADGALFQGDNLLVEFKGLRSASGGQASRSREESHQLLCEVPTGEK